jgi:hypothetical protein
MFSNKEAKTKGTNLSQISAKHNNSAKSRIANHEKRCDAGFIAESKKLSLENEFLEYAKHSAEVEKKKLHEQEIKRKNVHASFLIKCRQ